MHPAAKGFRALQFDKHPAEDTLLQAFKDTPAQDQVTALRQAGVPWATIIQTILAAAPKVAEILSIVLAALQADTPAAQQVKAEAEGKGQPGKTEGLPADAEAASGAKPDHQKAKEEAEDKKGSKAKNGPHKGHK